MATDILLESGTNELEIVEFYIESDGYTGYYGINVAKVVEILQSQKPTAVPEMQHQSIVGIFPHRTGRVVPIIDLSVFFGGNPISSSQSKLIITEFNRTITGFIVSGVTRIHRLSWTQVEAPDKIMQHSSGSFITATVRLEDRITFIVDLEGILASMDTSYVMQFDGFEDINFDNEKPIRVLHVDDSEIIRQIVYRILKDEKRMQLVQAKNGQEALDMLYTMRDNNCIEFDAIITDIEMPKMDGLTLCKKIKEDQTLKHLPVAIFSSLVNSELSLKCKSVGADAQYSKPDLNNICKFIVDLVSPKKSIHISN